MKKVLLIEDEPGISQMIRIQLKMFGFEVCLAPDATTALKPDNLADVEVIILDWMLPDEEGPSIIPKIRQHSRAPILMLTARSELIDKLMGFEAGVDDYLTKPFEMMELIARIKALARRNEPVANQNKSAALVFGDLSMDLTTRRVQFKNQEIELTPTEFKILEIMMKQPGIVLSRNDLIEQVMGYEYEGYGRTLDSHIARLRGKIEPDAKAPKYIKTIFGVGYKFGE